MAKSRRTTASNIILTNTARRRQGVARGWIFTVGTDNFIRYGWWIFKKIYNRNSCKIIMMAYNAWFCAEIRFLTIMLRCRQKGLSEICYTISLAHCSQRTTWNIFLLSGTTVITFPVTPLYFFFQFRTEVSIVWNVFYNISDTHRATSMYIAIVPKCYRRFIGRIQIMNSTKYYENELLLFTNIQWVIIEMYNLESIEIIKLDIQ